MDLLKSFPPDLLSTNREPNAFELAAARDLLPRIERDLLALYPQIPLVEARLTEFDMYGGTYFNFISPTMLKKNNSELAAAQMVLPSVEFEVYRQMVETETHLTDLVSQKNIQEQNLVLLRSIISPIRRVPHDILCYIFQHCKSLFPTSLSAKGAPILLTHVCSSFRRIALRMPMLWTTALFKIGRMKLPDSFSHKEKEAANQMLHYQLAAQGSGMEQYLLRSGSLTLDLEIDYRDYPKEVDKETRDLYFNMNKIVLSCHARWRDVRISYHDRLPEEIMAHLRSLTPDDLPLIRTLDLEYMEKGDNISDIEFIPILSCPTLKTVRGFRLDRLRLHRNVVRTSFANLTTLTGTTSGCSVLDIVTTLQMCPSLVKLDLCQLRKPRHSDIEIDNDFIISFPYLEYLHISEESRFNNYDFMITNYFSAPKLERLEYQGGRMYPSLVGFFKRSTSLTVLQMDVNISAALFIEALRCCPQLLVIKRLPRLRSDELVWPPTRIRAQKDEKLEYDRLFTRLVDADYAGDMVCPNLEILSHEDEDKPIPILRFDTLEALIMRKITPSPGINAWRYLHIANVCISTKKKKAAEDLLRKCRNSQIFLGISTVP